MLFHAEANVLPPFFVFLKVKWLSLYSHLKDKGNMCSASTQCILGGSSPPGITMFCHFCEGGQELADCFSADWTVSVVITHLCHCNMKIALNKWANEHSCVPIKLFIKPGGGSDVAPDSGFPTYTQDILTMISSLLFSHSVVSNSVTSWTAALQASLSFTISWNLLKLTSIESAMPSNHLILCHLLLLLPSIFSSIRDFYSELALHIRWPKY